MNIFIDTVEQYSGGYLSYMKGLLSETGNIKDLNLFINCSKKMFNKLELKNVDINLLLIKNEDKSLISKIIFQKIILPNIIEKYKIDLLFISSSTMNFFTHKDIPVVTTCLNVHPFTKNEVKRYGLGKFRLKLEIMKFMMNKSFKKSNGVIFHSNHAKNLIKNNIFIKNDIVIPTGIRKDYFNKPQMKTFNKKNIKILYVSSVFLYKHQWNVIRAVEKLRKKTNINFNLKLIGNGEHQAMKKTYSCLNELNNPKYIEFMDNLPIPFKDLPHEYKNSDIFVFASSCENLPNNLLEAMASGNPIACSNLEPMTEILGDAAEYFTPEDPDSLVSCVERIIYNSSIAFEKANKAFKISQNYTWKKCAEETFQYFNKTIDIHKKNN